MSIRVKAVLIIMSIVFAVTAAYFFLSLSFTRQNLVKAIEQDMSLAIDIADDLISTKISLLKSDAATIAERLLQTGSTEEMVELMLSQLDEYHGFTSLTVYDRDGIVSNGGEDIYHDEMHTNYLEIAFDGGTIISTTHYNGIGSFIMHVFVPMGQDYVFSATFSGMLFTDLLSGYRLWDTGSIFMLDETGTLIAYYRNELVTDRRNYLEEPETAADSGISDFFRNIISTESGSGAYYFDGVERLCFYKHITSSMVGWRVAVAVPLSESPLVTLQKDLMISAFSFLIAGLIISILVSGLVTQPFYKIKEQNRILEELNEKVLAASEAKTNFLASMSHEMRTPLNAIIGLSELTLGSGELDKENSSNLEKINNAGMTLLSTVNDILDISKIEAGKFELISVEYDVPSLLNDTITQSIMRIGEKLIQFTLNIDKNLPARLFGDDLRVKQILNNLLSNAFKYTREGTVDLDVSSVREGDAVWLTARVTDTGMGIRKEDLGKLYTNYASLEAKSNRKIERTGLGLPITKKLAEMMGGSITVESEYGKGSVFTVKFQQHFVNDAVIGTEVVESLKKFSFSDEKRDRNSRMVRISLPYARVLVVDDVATNLDVARGMLKPYSVQVDCMMSGQEAVDAIRVEKVRYNAIFMDHMMPEMDGIEAVRIIREEIGTVYAKNVPIIALTANAIVGNEEMFLSRGFQAFIPKPIEINRLDSVIREWVRDKEQEKMLSEINTDGITVQENRSGKHTAHSSNGIEVKFFDIEISGIDFNKGVERFGGSHESFLHVLRSYMINTPALLEKASGVSKENLADYAITVHGIKGSSRGICAEIAGARAEALEEAAKKGNYDFVMENNASFIKIVDKLIHDLKERFEKLAIENPKPRKDKPDSETLVRLSAACASYDMDGVDAAMAEIEDFEYNSDEGLTAWLRENVDLMNFKQIGEKLAALAG